jgi:hypothetical protein
MINFSQKSSLFLSLVLMSSIIIGCNAQQETESPQTDINSSSNGTINLVANGEDLIRQGMTSKDGWQIQFDKVYVTLSDVTAYQTDSAFNPEEDSNIQASQTINLVDNPTTVDLAEGNEEAKPIQVVTKNAPSGHYNAISWKLLPNNNDAENKNSIILEGSATKDNQNVKFNIQLNPNLAYTCGEFVGDERKGFLDANGTTELEVTFHFDHVFGDSNIPQDDTMNQEAFGFSPFANLAENNQVTIDQDVLKSKISPEEYQKLEKNLKGLGHVGEGHCELQNS